MKIRGGCRSTWIRSARTELIWSQPSGVNSSRAANGAGWLFGQRLTWNRRVVAVLMSQQSAFWRQWRSWALAAVCWTSLHTSYLRVFYLQPVAWCHYNSTAPSSPEGRIAAWLRGRRSSTVAGFSWPLVVTSLKRQQGRSLPEDAISGLRGCSRANKREADFCRCSFSGEMIRAKWEPYDLMAQASCSAAQIMQMPLMPHPPNK